MSAANRANNCQRRWGGRIWTARLLWCLPALLSNVYCWTSCKQNVREQRLVCRSLSGFNIHFWRLTLISSVPTWHLRQTALISVSEHNFHCSASVFLQLKFIHAHSHLLEKKNPFIYLFNKYLLSSLLCARHRSRLRCVSEQNRQNLCH